MVFRQHFGRSSWCCHCAPRYRQSVRLHLERRSSTSHPCLHFSQILIHPLFLHTRPLPAPRPGEIIFLIRPPVLHLPIAPPHYPLPPHPLIPSLPHPPTSRHLSHTTPRPPTHRQHPPRTPPTHSPRPLPAHPTTPTTVPHLHPRSLVQAIAPPRPNVISLKLSRNQSLRSPMQVCAILASSDPFQSPECVDWCLTYVTYRRQQENASSPKLAVVIVDCLRDYDPLEFSARAAWVYARLVACGFDKYHGILLAEAFRPLGQARRKFRNTRVKDLTVDLLMLCTCVVFCGGNSHAALESFHQASGAILDELRRLVQAGLCVLLAWSAGATVCGESAECTRDRRTSLVHSTHRDVSLCGLRIVPNYSFCPHCPRMQATWWLLNWAQNRSLRYTPLHSWMVSLPDHTFVVFQGSAQPTYWNSPDIGWMQRIR